jgi:hypothetical protein
MLPIALLLLLSTAAHAQKIKVEYDKNVDFSQFKTYAWDEFGQETNKPLLRLAIQGAIEDDLNKRGLKKVDSNPDLRIQAYGAVDSDAAVTYHDMYYGPGGIAPFDQSFLMYGAIPGSVTTAVVHKGQLVVDLLDANQKKLVWRGMSTQKLSEQRSKLLNQVNTAVEKMFAQYPVKK